MSQKRVLVVDDNATNLKLITYLLANEQYEISTAQNAQRALEMLRAQKPDLLLLDLQLPDMDGLELTRILRADLQMANLPIIAVTAYAMKGDEDKARAAGVDGYVTKPIAKDEFRRTVARYLRAGASEPPARATNADLSSAAAPRLLDPPARREP